jgi:hypothetical protein
MELFELPETTISTLVAAPEAGMGYQLGRLVSSGGLEQTGFFIASSFFVPEEPGDMKGNPAARDFSKLLLVEAPTPASPVVKFGTNFRVAVSPVSIGSKTALSAQPAAPLPPHVAMTAASDVFYRVSAFSNDRRVFSNGSLAPQSYSTTDTDITVVPNGLAAIGRYAMPTRMSARYVYEIRPGAGVAILFGTVTPNYGLAGGGVEVYFPNGTKPNTAKLLKAKILPEK